MVILVTPDGLKPDPKAKAILEMATPIDKQSLQSLLGMVTKEDVTPLSMALVLSFCKVSRSFQLKSMNKH